MDLNKLARKAREAVDKRGGVQGLKEAVDKRGGVQGLKEDAAHLRDIARQKGSMSDKAKQAMETVRKPTAHGAEADGGSQAAGEASTAGGATIPGEGPEVVRAEEMGQPPEDAEVVETADEVHTPAEVQTASGVQSGGKGVHTSEEVQAEAEQPQA